MIILFLFISVTIVLVFSRKAEANSNQLILTDDFTSSTEKWGLIRDTWHFTSHGLEHDLYAIGAVYLKDKDTLQNYAWETEFRVNEWGNEHGSLTFFIRMQELWVGYGITINPRSISLLRYDGAWNEKLELGEYQYNLQPLKWYQLKICIQANSLKVYLDNKLLISSGDPHNLYLNGTIGYYADYTTVLIKKTTVCQLPEAPLVAVKIKSQDIFNEDDTSWPGYLKQGGTAAGGASHIVLWYSHFNWTEKEMLPYVAYLKRQQSDSPNSAEFVDWFYDTFLFLYNFGDSRISPTDFSKWEFWLEKLFGQNKDLDSLNKAVELVKQTGQVDLTHKVKVILMIPYPSIEQKSFGLLDGNNLNFSTQDRTVLEANRDRLTAVKWYLDKCFTELKNKDYPHLELIGFYWQEESADSKDIPLIKKTSELIHSQNKKFFWIPMFEAIGYQNWQAYGFDAVMMQPNYFWPQKLTPKRLEKAAAMARKYHLGIEIEYDNSVKIPFFRKRFYEYLDYGVKTGYMQDALIGYYEGGGGLLELFSNPSPEMYALYTRLFEFVKGKYQTEGC